MSKKKILLLFPYVISDHTYYHYEMDHLDKQTNIELITHDLSSIIYSKKFNSAWNCINKNNSKIKKFNYLLSWLIFIYKIKNKNNIWVYNFVRPDNLKSFIINLFIKLCGFAVIIIYPSERVAVSKSKKNTLFFLKKVKKYLFNIKFLLFYANLYFFSYVDSFFNYRRLFILYTGKEKISFKKNYKKTTFFIKSHSCDYSNYLTYKKKYNNLKNTVVYLDSPDPYFTDDFNLMNLESPKNIHSWYNSLNLFFLKLKNNFNLKTIIIPHPKNKGCSNPYFDKKIINHDIDAVAKLIPNCAAVVSKGSTAISHAIINYKPIIFIYSKWYSYKDIFLKNILYQAKLFDKKVINIDKFSLVDISKNFHVNKKKYDQYKYKYITCSDVSIYDKPNYKIIKDILFK
jgi:hypothetical protein